MDFITVSSHNPEFYKKNNIALEPHITRDESNPLWAQMIPFIKVVHLPYASEHALNIAAYDDARRNADIAFLEASIQSARQYNVERAIIHTCGFECIENELVGCYERMIDAMKRLAKVAKMANMTLCIENMVLRAPEKRHLYGSNAVEWLRIFDDVAEPNVRLTLDTSHAASSVIPYATFEERQRHIFDFLAKPERIAHVHWSDSRIATQGAMFADLHLVPGDGDLPISFHRQIKQLDATFTLEQHCGDEDTLRGVNFIQGI